MNFSTLGRIGAHVTHSRFDGCEITAPARRAFLDRFEREADPDGTLDPAERARRASHLKRAYFGRLALKSAQARRRRAQRENGGQAS
jgi:hypothetical protein